jgi:beta-mannosidase
LIPADGWELACVSAGQELGSEVEWIPASVPGTAAAALRDSGRWKPGDVRDFDADDWWFRTRFEAEPPTVGEQLLLTLDGIATVSEVYLNGERVLESDSMFAAHEIDVSELIRDRNELVIRCAALGPLLSVSRRPRARWRTKLVSAGNLRFFRTMLLGRAPGFAPGPAAVGPWKPVRLERRTVTAATKVRLRTRVRDGEGVLHVSATRPEQVAAMTIELTGPTGTHHTELSLDRAGASGELVVPGVELWWPHTHGEPCLYDARLLVDEQPFDVGRVGFRALSTGEDLERDGIQLRINDVPVFARGAVWTPLDLAMPASSGPGLRAALERVVAAGMNMLRVPGIGCYESDQFYDLCDELGILVWQDFMFANLDYPEADQAFMSAVEREARSVLDSLGFRPSLAVLCGGSEVAQQVAMLGLDPSLASGPLYGELLPALVAEADVDGPYVPSTPWGGDLPFRPNRGVANYYGVGAYLRPLSDARLADVRFAAESLAFSNVPDEAALAEIDAPGGLVAHHPRWKAGIPRDAGAGWDFEDVRDHYLKMLYELDPVALRSVEHERYLELSRSVTGEVMSEVLGEWRRAASPCGGGLILWLTDLVPGAGWGVLDHRAEPKVAYHHVRRALSPVAAWSTDEGLGGVVAHVANERSHPLRATLRIALYRDHEVLVDEISRELELPPHGYFAAGVEELLGRFVDISWSYRFGPPTQDLVVLSLERDSELLSQSVRLIAGCPELREPAARLGLAGALRRRADGGADLSVSSTRLAYGVRVAVSGFEPSDDAFSIEPGHGRELRLRPAGAAPERLTASITALNLAGRLVVSEELT